MLAMAQVPIQPPPSVAMAEFRHYHETYSPKPSSSIDNLRYRASTFSERVLRRRYLLVVLALVVIVIMAISILFVAHAYYVQWGGQGFLTTRDILLENDLPSLFLPVRKVQVGWDASKGEDSSLLENLPWNLRALGPGSNVPFYTCGDQHNSCEAYDQPNICCPFGLNCYKGTFTRSGIFCCNSTVSGWSCEHAEQKSPKCLDSLVECSVATGGGCCPSALECSPNGCVHVRPASTVKTPSDFSSIIETGSASQTASDSSSAPKSVTMNSISITGTPITVTNTIFAIPKATVTLAKSGEVLESGSGAGESLVTRMHLPYSFGGALLGVALCMGMM